VDQRALPLWQAMQGRGGGDEHVLCGGLEADGGLGMYGGCSWRLFVESA
jgi:hypothetical protein